MIKRAAILLFMVCGYQCNKKPVEITYQELLDQHNYITTGAGGLEVTKNQKVAQTFTTGMSGILSRIRIYNVRQHRGIPQYNLNVRILKLTKANSIEQELMAFSFAPVDVPSANDSIKHLELVTEKQNVQTVAGETLGIELSCSCEGGGATYAWDGEFENYSNGTCLINDMPNLRDMAFESYVKIRN
jgi:hypothetical protein